MLAVALWFSATVRADDAAGVNAQLNAMLKSVLQQAGFTGRIESTLEARLGREIDPALANLGQLLFFDRGGGLHDDNICAGCHSPAAGFGDTQSIAIGVQNNLVVGPDRTGPRNQRRSPSVVNTAFYPSLMWNGRFSAPSGYPFDNSLGFLFPPPEGATKFPAKRPARQAPAGRPSAHPADRTRRSRRLHRNEGHDQPALRSVRRWQGECCAAGRRFGLPQRTDQAGRAGAIERQCPIPATVRRTVPVRRWRRADRLHDVRPCDRRIRVHAGLRRRADRPVRPRPDECDDVLGKARGPDLLWQGQLRELPCGRRSSNEMFSDFRMHVAGVPQIAPEFGVDKGNVIFDGPGEDEDFGLEQVTGNPNDRYKFRSSPLRNVALQPAFFRNGAFTRLEDAIRHHLDVHDSARATTTRPKPVSTRTFATESGRSNRYWHASIRCWPRRSVFRNMNSRTFCISGAGAGATPPTWR